MLLNYIALGEDVDIFQRLVDDVDVCVFIVRVGDYPDSDLVRGIALSVQTKDC